MSSTPRRDGLCLVRLSYDDIISGTSHALHTSFTMIARTQFAAPSEIPPFCPWCLVGFVPRERHLFGALWYINERGHTLEYWLATSHCLDCHLLGKRIESWLQHQALFLVTPAQWRRYIVGGAVPNPAYLNVILSRQPQHPTCSMFFEELVDATNSIVTEPLPVVLDPVDVPLLDWVGSFGM